MLGEVVVPLLEPVAMLVGLHGQPSGLSPFAAGCPKGCHAAEPGHLGQLLFAGKVVADVVEEDAPLLRGVGVLDQEGDGDGRAAAFAKDLATLFAGDFARGALVAPQVKDVEAAVLLRQALAEAATRLRIDPARVGHKAHDAAVLNPIARPANRPNVGIVERFYF